MVRTQVQFEEDQFRRLKERAAVLGVSVAELVRRGVEAVLREAERDARWARAWRAVGSASSGLEDLAEDHDRHAWADE